MSFSWKNLPKPFFALAPMEGGTDTVFRQIVNSCGKPEVMFTEFTNCEGLLSKGREEVGKRLIYTESERPLIAQIWGIKPKSFYQVAKQLVEMRFDGIDINMGCPERTVVAHGCCAALIENPALASEIIQATREGILSCHPALDAGSTSMPVSVKTRIGFKTIETEKWLGFLLEQNLDAITVHFRTQKEMSLVPAHWEEAGKISIIKKQKAKQTILIGNGDIMNKKHGRELAEKYGLDGIMMGRAVFHNPYVFDENNNYDAQTKKQRLELLKKHLNLFEITWKQSKSFAPLKRYFKIYINGFEGAAELREKLMLTHSMEEVREIISG